ncbi:colicin V production protein [Mumia flava]|uniref:Colicin V production protein n=1 Tax=Mumia flava TaxID=1348852 RepID=A0A0B2BEJ2_9ACTN|nr:MarP family serine protease [Mumia flava]PJJ57391.1 colicin V production protein [Mumia flava]
MNLVDVAILLVVVAYAAVGYWRGFVAGFAGVLGLLVGGSVGLVLVPLLLGGLESGLGRSLLALMVVLVLASSGQAIGSHFGGGLRDRLTTPAARAADAAGGVALSVAAVLVLCWALGYAVSGAQIPGASSSVRGSKILATIDGVMPDPAREALHSFDGIVDSTLFPRYLDPFAPETIEPAAAPDPEVLKQPGVRKARRSVARITGQSSCDRMLEGSGFVFASDRVMTNAHVVAGVTQPYVTVRGQEYEATTVVYDPDLDVAVLRVIGLRARPLAFDPSGAPGDDAAVLGFPENGPFDARAARIRSEQRLRSRDIYGEQRATREVFSLRSLVRPGNSGGPVISSQGRVYGVVFAASVEDSSTGYALTADQVAEAAEDGRTAMRPVSTGACAR